jgi:hypothetical protein
LAVPGCGVETERRGEVVERAAEDEEFSGVKMGKGAGCLASGNC